MLNYQNKDMTKLSLKRTPRRLPRLVSQQTVSLPETSEDQFNHEVFDKCCYQIFEQLRPELIENHYNWFIIIEPESGDYFMDEDELVAFQKARENYPQHQFFFFRLNETGICGKI
jgi:hypothetical protein